MKDELQSTESPLDANLQSVLPGVHQQLEVHREELACLRGDVGRLTTAVETHTLVFNKKVDEIMTMNDEKNKVLGRMHIMVGSKLLGETEGEGSPSSSPPQALLQENCCHEFLVKGMRLPGITWPSPLRAFSQSTMNGMGGGLTSKIFQCQGALRRLKQSSKPNGDDILNQMR